MARPRSSPEAAVGAVIRRLRTARGLSQRELGSPRFTGSYISALENGHARPSQNAILHVADKLGVTPGSILDGEPRSDGRIDLPKLLAAEEALDAAARALRTLRESLATEPEAARSTTASTSPTAGGRPQIKGLRAARRRSANRPTRRLKPAPVGKPQRAPRAGPRLHEEIISILEEHGGPMSARDIAEQVRSRGRYRPPRRSTPVDSGQISARVSNPTYRDRFVRREGGIWLANP